MTHISGAWLRFVWRFMTQFTLNVCVLRRSSVVSSTDGRILWRRHVFFVYWHRAGGLSANNTETTDGYQCENCGKVFAYRYYRDKHMRISSSGSCCCCCSRDKHMKYTRCIDHGDRQFPCQLCTRLFTQQSFVLCQRNCYDAVILKFTYL